MLCGVSTACGEENQNGNHAPSGFPGLLDRSDDVQFGKGVERWKFVDGRSVRQSRQRQKLRHRQRPCVRLDLNAIGIEFIEVIEPRCVGDGSENG